MFFSTKSFMRMESVRLRAVPLRSVTSMLGRTGESELTERGTGERREEDQINGQVKYFLWPPNPSCQLALIKAF